MANGTGSRAQKQTCVYSARATAVQGRKWVFSIGGWVSLVGMWEENHSPECIKLEITESERSRGKKYLRRKHQKISSILVIGTGF